MSNDPRSSKLISTLLAGAWRQKPPAPNLSLHELENIAPLLIASGGGALAFWKIRGTEFESTPVGQELKQVYRLNTLHAAIHELEIKQVIDILARVDVEPILVKGWSMARHFPEPALRPYGDIDLFVRPEEFNRAQKALASEEGRKVFVDLHKGSEHLCDQPFEDLWSRSFRVTPLGEFRVTPSGVTGVSDLQLISNEETLETHAPGDDAQLTPKGVTLNTHAPGDDAQLTPKGVTLNVRVLSTEDHLRILCIHFLHHGAWRPAGLCDIALIVESQAASFDWDVCLTKNRTRARWIECTVRLAHELLDADISSTPFSRNSTPLPRWFVPAVMKEWENPVSIYHVVPPPLADRLTHPVETIRAIRRRWPPNPIQASVVTNAPFNDCPRIVFQAENFLSRTAKFLRISRKT